MPVTPRALSMALLLFYWRQKITPTQNGLTKRARIVSMAIGTCDPRIMLDAPADAARRCLANAGMTTSDIDLWEINEAFAVVPLKFMREMNLDPEIVNVNGGAMALGHPIGATGAMLVGTLLDELERSDLSTGLITLCAAGGMAPAMIIEAFKANKKYDVSTGNLKPWDW